MSRRKLSALLSACAVISALTASTVLTTETAARAHPGTVSHRAAGGPATHDHHHDPSADPADPADPVGAASAVTPEQVQAEISPEEVAALGEEHAAAHARTRLTLRGVGDYPQTIRTNRLAALTESQTEANAGFDAAVFGRFAEYFPSPEFGVHIAQLPTGKVLLFSFERMETNPQKETAPTDTIGAENAGRAYLWDPAKGSAEDAFEAVPPPSVDMPDGLGVERPAPLFCAGHAFLPNGMLAVFGGNLGGNGGAGAKLSFVFDPWTKTWTRNPDMSVGRWYPSVVTGADGRQLIMSGQSELGWGTPTSVVERFPALGIAPEHDTKKTPTGVPVDRFGADAPFTRDYPHLFSMNDGTIHALGRAPAEQWSFDPITEARTPLPARPDLKERTYGSAVPLPNGFEGPVATLVLGGDRDNPNTYRLGSDGWTTERPRAFGRTQDDTLILPDGALFTVNGSYDIRDYGNGKYNPNADLKYRQTEMRDAQGYWRLGPVQRLPRGYHSNAVVLPDGRIMVTGDEAQQLANDPDITDDNNGSIEIYEPAYLHKGPRPVLDDVEQSAVGYGARFRVSTSTPDRVARAVLLSPTTATHSVNTSQRHLELRITSAAGDMLELQAPPSAKAAPPGFYMLFLLDGNGVPSTAQWVQLTPTAPDSAPDSAGAR
ncbi:galactose oxidase early set domain-containing protein [Kitasatospora camelliae]|uniref:Galactose oxidase early set domain-containing protein n=1 Tax=Kitasatospora camelliae TaxID=3156397 RepID=A0AAU8JN60_9ACTN